MMQNDDLLRFTIFFDVETKLDMEEAFLHGIATQRLEWLCVCARFYYGGLAMDPKLLILKWKHVFPDCDLRSECRTYRMTTNDSMYWGMEFSNDVARDFFDTLMMVVEAVRVIQCTYTNKKDLNEDQYLHFHWMYHGMTMCGYNSNNFDNFGFIQEVIRCKSLGEHYDFTIIPGTGTSTKGFNMRVKGVKGGRVVLLRSHDLMEMVGPVSLSKCVSDFVTLLLGKRDRLLGQCGLLTQFERIFLTKTEPIHGKTFETIQELQSLILNLLMKDVQFRPSPIQRKQPHNVESLKKFADQVLPHMEQVKSKMGHFWLAWGMREQKKGCPPLKLMQSFSLDEYRELGELDLSEVVRSLGMHKVFFERELNKVSEMDLTKPYCVHKEMQEYCEQDVLLTEAVYRAYNNALYYLAPEEFQMPSGLHGVRRSVLDFRTLADLAEKLSVALFPPELIMNRTPTSGSTLQIKLPLYTVDQTHQFRSIPGGKVIPRQILWESTDHGQTDYCLYLDSSGMYMYAMMEYEYPYGMLRKFFYQNDPVAMESIREEFVLGGGLKQCRFMYVTRSLHPMETEPPAGYRVKDIHGDEKVVYNNFPVNTWETNVSLYDILQAGGSVHRIWYCMEWEHQSKFLQAPMRVYDRYKNQSVGAQRSLYKGIANRTYGVQLKKENFSSMEIVHDCARLGEIFRTSTVQAFVEVSGGFCVQYNTDVQAISKRCAHMGAFVLTWSRHDQNKAISEAYGKDRFDPSCHRRMIRYGDTDSMIMDVEHVRRLVSLDRSKGSDWNNRRLFLPEVPMEFKAGKLTDELADDIHKYIPKDEAVELLKNGFPDISTGFCGRVIANVSPRPKVNGVKLIFPRAFREDGTPSTAYNYDTNTSHWHVAYKMTCKGIPKGSLIYLGVRCNTPVEDNPFDAEAMATETPASPSEVEGVLFENSEACFELFRQAVNEFRPIRCVATDRLKKLGINLNKKQLKSGRIPFDIQNVRQFERQTLKSVWLGRDVVFRDIESNVSNGTFVELYESYTLPKGYQEEPYSQEQIDACFKEAETKIFF